ncbi:SMI1/KNR4 family protein [Phenylobacterium sp.]|uniref:SMI1/KNR4 family protein n=1 Tax=Phenylobacterium sp. TaxID=1871053 RepID=UPI0030039436
MRSTRRTLTLGLGAALAATSRAVVLGQERGARASRPGDIAFGEELVSDFERERRKEGRLWARGYTQSELDEAQKKYDLVFPPDLVAFFRDRRPVLGYDWRSDENEIRAMLKWPLEGLLFDVEQNALWWPEWGERPPTPEERAEVLTKVVNAAPKMIPLLAHRYLPTEPHEAGNPVFSVRQADTIYYGANLGDYFEREFGDANRPWPKQIKHIRFWSDLVERNR